MADNAGEPGSWLDSSVFAAMNKTLKGRKLEKDWDVTTPAQDEEHRAINRKADGSLVVRTRFPPEPNGYLHIGHAKSMNMNFSLAFEKLGVPPENRETVFRFDDTNPEAECEEYIDNIREDVAWMGWTPVRTTHASDSHRPIRPYSIRPHLRRFLAPCGCPIGRSPAACGCAPPPFLVRPGGANRGLS